MLTILQSDACKSASILRSLYLSGKVHHCVDVVLFEHKVDQVGALNVSFNKLQGAGKRVSLVSESVMQFGIEK